MGLKKSREKNCPGRIGQLLFHARKPGKLLLMGVVSSRSAFEVGTGGLIVEFERRRVERFEGYLRTSSGLNPSADRHQPLPFEIDSDDVGSVGTDALVGGVGDGGGEAGLKLIKALKGSQQFFTAYRFA